jgi:hypothetical protein
LWHRSNSVPHMWQQAGVTAVARQVWAASKRKWV